MEAVDSLPVVIAGGGLGGLAAACTLAARGYPVTLLDKNAWLGGKAAVHNEAGFRFDMGPTILTLPSVLRRIFAEAGRKMEDYLDLVRLDPQWRCFFSDGSTLDLEADVDSMSASLNRIARVPGEGRGYSDFIRYAERLAGISDRYFFWRSVGSVRDTLDLSGSFRPGVLGDLLAMRMGETVSGTIRGFVDDPRVAQMLDHFTQYVGSSPEASPAVLCGIAAMQVSEGVWYPMGGTRSVPLALERLARELGVEIRTGRRVERILVERGSVRGVQLAGGETIRASAVVSNGDAVRTYEELLDDRGRRPYRTGRFEPACSGVVLYLGLRERYPQLRLVKSDIRN
jgi:phytoene desaturase